MPTLRFKKVLVAKAEIGSVWQEFEKAFSDSLESPIWPNEIEVLRSEGLKTGNKVLVEYYSPLKVAVKRSYKILGVEPKKSFSYAPIQPHAFSGKATVEFVSKGAGKTEIVWSGTYKFKGIPLALLYFKFYFEKHFFESLQRGLNSPAFYKA